MTATVGGAAGLRCAGRVLAAGHANTPGPAVVHVGYSITVWLTVLTKVLTMVLIVSSLTCDTGSSCGSACVVASPKGNGGTSARHNRLLTLRQTVISRGRKEAEALLLADIWGREGEHEILGVTLKEVALGFSGMHISDPLSVFGQQPTKPNEI